MTLRETVSALGSSKTGSWTVIGLMISGLIIGWVVYFMIRQRQQSMTRIDEPQTTTNVTMEVPLVKAKDEERRRKPATKPRHSRTSRSSVLTELESMIGRVQLGKDKNTYKQSVESLQ